MKNQLRLISQLILLLSIALVAPGPLPQRCRAATTPGLQGVVASVDEHASRIGIEVLQKGGNAVDAAVAVHMVLAVTHPQAGNLGGGGFMIIHMEGTAGEDDINTAIDFREKAPIGARRDMYLDEEGEVIPEASTLGYLACGVPGSVAGMWAIHQQYGTLPWEYLLEPAYQMARDGFIVDERLAQDLADAREKLTRFPTTAAIFTKGGKTLEAGDYLMQEDLALTILRIMEHGRDGFYRGPVAERIAADMKANGGLITMEDLARYEPVWREPITCRFSDHTIVSMPPPSSGGLLLCQMLAMLADYDLKGLGHNSADYVQLLTEVEKMAYADRAEYLGDADFHPVPVDHLLSPDYIAVRAAGIDPERATPSSEITHGPRTVGEIEGSMFEEPTDRAPDRPGDRSRDLENRKAAEDRARRESPETTHFSIVDRQGNAVSCTTTLNSSFGSGVVAAGTGVLLNNEMDDFSMKPGVPNIYGLVGGEANAIEPEKRMLSSMTPTIVLEGAESDDDDVILVLGSPGGSTIITTVLQVILNVLVHEMPLKEAVGAPRFHHQWLPDKTRVESRGFSPDVLEDLEERGHNIRLVEALGDVHAVQLLLPAVKMVFKPGSDAAVQTDRRLPGPLIGVSDPRRGGVAFGY